MLERIRRQLVQGQRQGLRELGQHPGWPAVDADVVLGAGQKRRQHLGHQLAQIGARPGAACQQGVGLRHGLDAPVERLHERADRWRTLAGETGNRRHVAQDVFDAMVQLGHQQALALLRLLALRDVERRCR